MGDLPLALLAFFTVPAVLLGWGLFVMRAVLRRKPKRTFEVVWLVGIGASFTIMAGGWIVLAEVCRWPVAYAWLMGGLASLGAWGRPLLRSIRHRLGFWRKALARATWTFKMAAFAIVTVFVIRSASWLAAYDLPGAIDDRQGYFVFIEKMVQTGQWSPDPLCERRYSSLGGTTWIQTLMHFFVPLPLLSAWEPASCYLLLGWGAWLCARRSRLATRNPQPSHARTLLIVGIAGLYPNEQSNLTANLFPTALLLELYWRLGRRRTPPPMALGLMLAGIASMKATLVPIMAIVMLASAIRGCQIPSVAIKPWLIGGTGALLLLAPWSLLLFETAGTFFFPFLGSGYVRPAYATYGIDTPDGSAATLAHVSMAYPGYWAVLMAGMAAAFQVRARLSERLAAAFLMTSAIGYAQLGTWSIQSAEAAIRYSSPLLLISFLLSSCVALAPRLPYPPGRFTSYLLIPAFALILLRFFWFETLMAQVHLSDLRRALRGDGYLAPAWQSLISQAQESVPAGKRLVVMTRAENMAFDFARNPISVVDWAGGVSPPPGLPLRGPPEKLRQYLRDSLGADYLMIYLPPAGHPTETEPLLLRSPDPWTQQLYRRHQVIASTLRGLASERPPVFSEHGLMVIPLADTPPDR